MEKHQYSIGDRVEKMCKVCGEERGHVVTLINKKGNISRVTCPQCDTRSPYKSSSATRKAGSVSGSSQPYDWTRTYRKGQSMLHPSFGEGEVVAVIEPRKIDVLFADRVRRLIHSRVQA